MNSWKDRIAEGGVCDFAINYNFFCKWLLSKTASCIYLKNLPDTIDEFYTKSELIMNGFVCVTDFDKDLYSLTGAPGGQPDEYYKPTIYTIANPILGSKVVTDGENGVIIYNTPLDAYMPGGLFGLISQTATMLADNVISINCCQINTRVTAVFTADSEGQAVAGEMVLRDMYRGKPFKVMRSDLIEKINVNPIAAAGTSQTITELIELNNYIIANYFQSIGVKSNNIRKKEHLINREVDAQNDYLQISLFEILTAWQKGFDKVNEMYGTDIRVELNPALLDIIEGDEDDDSADINDNMDTADNNNPDSTENIPDELQQDGTQVIDNINDNGDIDDDSSNVDSVTDEIETQAEEVEDIVDMINDKKGDDTDANETEPDSERNDME